MAFGIRKLLAYFLAIILIKAGLVRRARNRALKGNYILSIYFHQPSKKLFESCVKWLQGNGFSFISVQDLMGISNKEQKFPKGAVLITVDDGWASNKDNIVAVANQMNIPVTIFISTEPVRNGVFWWSYVNKAKKNGETPPSVESMKRIKNEERLAILNEIKGKVPLPREAMTINQIRKIALDTNITLGSHTVNHPILPTCSNESAYQEIKESKSTIESWTGKPVDSFAYPNGSFTDREVQLLRSSGYAIAFSTQTDYLTPQRLKETYTLPRFEVFEKASFAENICRMTGVWFQKLNFLFRQ